MKPLINVSMGLCPEVQDAVGSWSLKELVFDLIRLVGAPFVTTLPVYMMYTASLGYELRTASVTAIVLMIPGAGLLLLLGRFLKSEYPVFFGQL